MDFISYDKIYQGKDGLPKKRKTPKVLQKARVAISSGNYSYTRHALARQGHRNISDADLKEAILSGWHEAKKDEWKEEYQDWNYSIRGPSLEGDQLRIALAIEENANVLAVIITVINLDK